VVEERPSSAPIWRRGQPWAYNSYRSAAAGWVLDLVESIEAERIDLVG
jgi:hypothetical protein